jgi:hypothetical protein
MALLLSSVPPLLLLLLMFVPLHSCCCCCCRWGYKDVEALADVVSNYAAAGLPLEVLWSDIEYMPKFWTMEFDPGVLRVMYMKVKPAEQSQADSCVWG